MKMVRQSMRLLWIGILIGMVLTFGTVVTSYASEGGPGVSCGEGFSYDPPPFIGVLTANYSDGRVLVSGVLQQMGTDCTGNFDKALFGYMSYEKFVGLKPSTLRQTCFTNDPAQCTFTCGVQEDGYLEVVGAGNMNWLDQYSFTVQLVIMPLK